MSLSIAKRAIHWSERTAVVDDARDRKLSYEEFAETIEQTAIQLNTLGIDPGDRVVTLANNRLELLSLLFAVTERGATLAPISYRLPAETVTTLCERIDPELVLLESEFADLVGSVDAEQTEFAQFAAGPTTSNRPAERVSEDAAEPLFLHTSGTTGVPKIVPISERQVEWNAITEAVAWGLGHDTSAVSVLPLFHTGGWNLLALPTLYAGGTVVIRPEFEPGAVLRCIEEYDATQLFAVPAIFRALANHPDFCETDFSTVEWFMSGGGPCPEDVMRPYRARGETFVQGYGLTEGGPNNLYYSPERAETAVKSDSVGRPFPDCEARLVGSDGTPIDGTGTGELELRGPVTADRYLKTEDGTFDGEWVSTGDVVRRDDDGDHFIVGRTDNMFVSGGENVYPEAIEDVLEGHESIESAVVIPISHEEWGKAPKALVVGTVSEEELDAYSRVHLADFQVPHEYEFVDELPKTGAGKFDRDTLHRQYGQ